MAPIHDTDVAEERWNRSEWERYELWEKVEIRLRRRKRIWIGATIVAFLVLSAVPVVWDRWPKWSTLSASRRLAREINQIKREASVNRLAYRIRFAEDGSLSYQIEKSQSCSDPLWTPVRSGALVKEPELSSYSLLNAEKGAQVGLPGLVDSVCYDYLAGSDIVLDGQSLVGFGLIPAKDLTSQRKDRISLLLLSGPSAEIAME